MARRTEHRALPAPGLRTQDTLVTRLRHRAEHQGDSPAFHFLSDGESITDSITYGQLHARARTVAACLRQSLAKGERTLLLYPSGLDYLVAFFACLYAGVLAVPAYPPNSTNPQRFSRLLGIIRDAMPRAVLTNTEGAGRLDSIKRQQPRLARLAVIATDRLDGSRAGELISPEPHPKDLAFLQYTSGSTGSPKGVMVSHGNLMANGAAIQAGLGLTSQDVGLSWLPFYHDMGLIGGILQPVYAGFPMLLMSPMRFLERPLEWLKAISHHRATLSGGPNFAYELCVRKIVASERAGLDLHCWKIASNGSEPIRPQTMERFAEVFAPFGFRRETFYPCYGLAEATLFVAGPAQGTPPLVRAFDKPALQEKKVSISTDDERAVYLPSCGRTWRDHEITIVEPESSEPCDSGRIGEIWVSGASIAQGYWNKREETERTFRAQITSGRRSYLRTGDLGFIHEDELFISGRLKDLIIIRGRNYHPQDIEGALDDSVAGLRPGCAVAFSVTIAGEERLVIAAEVRREIVRKGAAHEALFSAIRAAVAEACELEVFAIALLMAGVIPKTSSGKLRRQACKAAFEDGTLAVVATTTGSPSSAVLSLDEEKNPAQATLRQEILAADPEQATVLFALYLTDQIARLTGLPAERIALALPITRLGLDSLKAVELKHVIDDLLNIDLPLARVLDGSSIEQLAGYALAGVDQEAPAIADSNRCRHERQNDLSYGQQAIWLVHQLDANSIVYNLHLALRVHSLIDVEILRGCLQRITERHEALRTTYTARQDKPVATVEPLVNIGFRQIETGSAWTEAMRQAHLAAEIRRPFDLQRGPLLRATQFTHAAQDHTLLFCAHHIGLDFWSLVVLANELKALYAAARAGTSPTLPDCGARYRDFVAWQQQYLTSAASARAWEYWRQQLAGKLPILDLPTDQPRPSAPTYGGAAESLRIDPELKRALRSLAQRYNVTLYVVLLAAFKTLLFRYTQQDDLIIGSPTAGRAKGQFAGMVGHLVNPVALRTRPCGDLAFEAYLEQVRGTVLEALEHQDYPFSLLVKRLEPERELNRWPLYQVAFALLRTQSAGEPDFAALILGVPGVRTQLGEWQIESVPIEERVEDFDLTLMMAEHHDGLLASFQYSTSLFERATVVRLAAHFKNLLEAIVATPHARLGELSLLSHVERDRLLVKWNATQVVYPQNHCLHQLFEVQVERAPDAIAVVFENQRLTYGELNARANRLAHHLCSRGIGSDVLVGLCVERSLDMVVGILGILKAGGAYVPLDPSYPQARLAYMLADAQFEVLVTQQHLLASLPMAAKACACLDLDRAASQPDHNLTCETVPTNAAYVIYTSGSTGGPKGVVISHQAAVNLAYGLHRTIYAQQLQDAPLRVSLNAPLSFDASIQQLVMLLFGHTLSIVPEPVRSDGEAFLAWLQEHAIDVLDCTPTQLKLLLSLSAQQGGGLAPRRVLVGGEPIAESLWQTLAHTPDTQFYNVYGPTECTVDATACHVQLEPVQPLIGRPLANIQAYILSSEGEPVPVGVPGELYVGGAGLARAYLKRPDRTAERFIPNPFGAIPGARLYRTGDRARYRANGSIEYLGRLDHQVKVRGFRIEPGEIETALCAHPQVREAVVTAREGRSGDKRLIAYLVSADHAALEDETLRAHLRQTLPAYMVPSAFVWLEALPLTPNGKLDRRALPAPETEVQFEGQYAAPRTPTEQVLCDIWSEVLGIERVGVHDNFFALGGDSILSIQAVSRARQAGLILTPQQLFEQQTVAGLARLAGGSMTQAEQGSVSGEAPLTPIQHWFFDQSFLNPHHWNQALLLEAKEPLSPAHLEAAIANLPRHHDALRLRFMSEGDRWWQVNEAQLPPSALRRVDLACATAADQHTLMEQTTASLQAELDISRGPLLRAALFESGAEQPARLLMVIHHLVVDGISWRVLLEDLQTRYRQLVAGQAVVLPAKTTSYKRWTEQLQTYTRSEAIQTEADFWLAQARAPVEPLPIDDPTGDDTEAATEKITVSLSAEETQALLQKAPSAYRTEINDLLLTALAQTLCRWTSSASVSIDLEGHGREDLFEGIDVSRTVGWFTSLFPARLEADCDGSPGEAIKSVKVQLRQIPRKGLSYGLLRYLDPTSEIARQLAAQAQARVRFNYLGQLDRALPGGALFSMLAQQAGRDPRNRRTHELEIDSFVHARRLQLNWSFSGKRYRRASITALSQAYVQALQGLIAHCLSAWVGSYTPADFPDIEIDQATLERVLENID